MDTQATVNPSVANPSDLSKPGAACRIIIDPPAPGPWNMAVDEALLESTRRRSQSTLRLYQWESATLSLGYFQSTADRVQHAASQHCPLVRRHSGGGAIVHDRELTYCLTMPDPIGNARQAAQMVRTVHATLTKAFQNLGITAQLQDATHRQNPEPFLCFQRRSEGDVVIGPTKVVGSAQRRQRGVLLQHGSILLESSTAAPELRGIRESTGQTVNVEELWSHWAPHLSGRLFAVMDDCHLEPEEKSRVECIAREKYGADSWTRRR